MRWIAAFGRSTVPALLWATACGAQSSPDLIARLSRMGAAGNAEALYHLGMAYQTGSGVPVDHRRALAYFEQAAAKGDPLAAFKLGCFYDGQDAIVPPDAEKALRFDLIAANAGYALAQQDVAGLYMRRGEPAVAVRWLEQAAAQGWPDALMGLASLYNGQNGLPRDPVLMAGNFALFLRRTSATPAQERWLADLRAGMTPEQRRAADTLVANYRSRPSALTLKALSGQRAAEALVAR